MVKVETKVKLKSQGDGKVELQEGMTEVEAWAWQTRAKTMGVKTMEESEGRRSPAEPEG